MSGLVDCLNIIAGWIIYEFPISSSVIDEFCSLVSNYLLSEFMKKKKYNKNFSEIQHLAKNTWENAFATSYVLRRRQAHRSIRHESNSEKKNTKRRQDKTVFEYGIYVSNTFMILTQLIWLKAENEAARSCYRAFIERERENNIDRNRDWLDCFCCCASSKPKTYYNRF